MDAWPTTATESKHRSWQRWFARSIRLSDNLCIDHLDEFDDVPIASSTRGGGANAFPTGGSSAAAGLYPCSICNRSFASDRIQQHEAACSKASKQRRVFDSTKQRLEGTEAAAFVRKGKGGKGRSEPAKPQVNLIDNPFPGALTTRADLWTAT